MTATAPAALAATGAGTQPVPTAPSGAQSAAPAIAVRELRRVFGGQRSWLRRLPQREVVAVDGISFDVPRGTIFGLLGPNGAGKTTTIKMLSTLLLPTSGTATVGGHDVVREEGMVRRQLGVVFGGDRGLYAKLTARDHLHYFGTLYGMARPWLARRVAEVLELVNLADRADERVERFSRGMKQRLHLAKALLHEPPILVLDEPTMGLDPAGAVALRRAIAALVPERTVLLTTHDMHDADQLCGEIAIIDRGQVVAQGTADDLKARVAEHRRVVVSTAAALNGQAAAIGEELAAAADIRRVEHGPNAAGGADFTIFCDGRSGVPAALDAALAALRARSLAVSAVRVVEPTLEDAFLAIAGRSLT
jgi:ABC-2 type transport system ATP-binding protein